MNKQDLARKTAKAANVTIKEAALIIDTAFDAIADTLAEGEKVQISGFGTFEARTRAARTGINPRTKEPVEVKATTTPAFKAGAVLKAKVKK